MDKSQPATPPTPTEKDFRPAQGTLRADTASVPSPVQPAPKLVAQQSPTPAAKSGSTMTVSALDGGAGSKPPPIPTSDRAISRKVRDYIADRPDLAGDQLWLGLLCTYFIFRRHVERLNKQLTSSGVLTKADGKVKESFGVLAAASREVRALLEALPAPPPGARTSRQLVIVTSSCSKCDPPAPEGSNIFDDVAPPSDPDEGAPRPPAHPAEVTPAEGGAPVLVIQDPPDAERSL